MASIGTVSYSTLGGLSEQTAIAELKAEVQAVKTQTTSILQGVNTLKSDVALVKGDTASILQGVGTLEADVATIKTNTTPETP